MKTAVVTWLGLAVLLGLGACPAEPERAPARQQSASRSLHYRELVTGGASRDARLPLIVAIHGLGGDEGSFAPLFSRFDLPARVVLPRGTHPLDGGGRSWFGIELEDGKVGLDVEELEESARRIATLISRIAKQRPVRGRPVVMGFSQGGILAYTLAVKHPQALGLAVPIGGFLPPALLPKKREPGTQRPPIRAFHGGADRVIRPGLARHTVSRLRQAGFDVQLTESAELGHRIDPAMWRRIASLLREKLSPASGRSSDRSVRTVH